MKKIFLIAGLSFILGNCTSQNKNYSAENATSIQAEKNAEGEYELHVLDSDYDLFLKTWARPISQYEESFLKSRNRTLVNEWNAIYYSGRHRDVIESSIDYDSSVNYGLKYEYRLYQVFNYIYWRYGLRLNGVSQSEIR